MNITLPSVETDTNDANKNSNIRLNKYLDHAEIKKEIIRAGCLPYLISNSPSKKIYFLFAVDHKSGDLTDFGGGFSLKYDMLPLIAAARELHEESLGLFQINLKDMENFYSLYDKNTLITFIEVGKSPDKFGVLRDGFRELFRRKFAEGVDIEISDIVLVSEDEIMDKSHLIYNKVAKLLLPSVKDICEMIRSE